MTPQVPLRYKLTPYELKALGLLEFIFDCNLSKLPVNDYQSKHYRLKLSFRAFPLNSVLFAHFRETVFSAHFRTIHFK